MKKVLQVVSPAPAGMIPVLKVQQKKEGGEPRTRGDDPNDAGEAVFFA